MAGRNINQYVGLSRSVVTNKLLTDITQMGKTITFRHKFRGLLEESVFKWILSDHNTPTPHIYQVDKSATSIFSLAENITTKIAIVADWASDTVQSEKIGELIGRQQADYTVHMGDIYYSGSEEETNANFGNGRWPDGKTASFALLGNHEMYKGAVSYFNTLLPQFKQPNPFFCIRNAHWCILGLDTGYQSIQGGPSNTNLKFQDELIEWLTNTVKLQEETRGIVVLTHHQYITAFGDEKNFQNPAWQLQEFLKDGREIIWIWGHEHRFSVYGKYKEPNNGVKKYVTAHGRCIGHGGMPVELTKKKAVIPALSEKYNLILSDTRKVDTLSSNLFWNVAVSNNGYSVLELTNVQLVIKHFSSYTNDESISPVEQLILEETWSADNTNGNITCDKFLDMTIDATTGKSELTYYNELRNDIAKQ